MQPPRFSLNTVRSYENLGLISHRPQQHQQLFTTAAGINQMHPLVPCVDVNLFSELGTNPTVISQNEKQRSVS